MNYEKAQKEIQKQIEILENQINLAQEKKLVLENQLHKLKLEEMGIQKTLLFG